MQSHRILGKEGAEYLKAPGKLEIIQLFLLPNKSFTHCSLSLEKATGNVRKIINWQFQVIDLLFLLCVCHGMKEKQERVLPRYGEEKNNNKNEWDFVGRICKLSLLPFTQLPSHNCCVLQQIPWKCFCCEGGSSSLCRARDSCPQSPSQEWSTSKRTKEKQV